jgi:hypothetical protein
MKLTGYFQTLPKNYVKFDHIGHAICYVSTTHLYKHVCPHTALVRVILVLEGVQVYVGHALSALHNKQEAQFIEFIIITSTETFVLIKQTTVSTGIQVMTLLHCNKRHCNTTKTT